jgi:hypothetical protein
MKQPTLIEDARVKALDDIFKDESIRVIGIVANPNEGKSNTIYHLIDVLKTKYNAKVYAYGLKTVVDGVQDIHRIDELEAITNSVVFIDEFYSFFRMSSRKSAEKAEDSLRTIYHANNIIILAGLPHNFNKFVSGLLQTVIFKQSTLEDFIQRSSLQQFMASYSHGFQVRKGSAILAMPKNVALVWMGGKHSYEVDVPYCEYGDSKRFNVPVITPKIKAR